jgi:hypothetical protein
MWLIKLKDIDPDTGETSQEKVLAQSENHFHAEMIARALAEADFDQPNRVYFTTRLKNDDDKG